MKKSRTSLAAIAVTAVTIGLLAIKIAGNDGEETKPAPPQVPIAIQDIFSQKGRQNGESQSFLYDAARHDLALQEQWIIRVLAKYGLQGILADFVIITPQNAHRYNYDLAKPPSHTELFINSGLFEIEDFGTSKVPRPMLYLPSGSFEKTGETDLESLIAFHMVDGHARALRGGFAFGGISLFRNKDAPNSYNLSVLDAVLELDAYKNQLERGSSLMSAEYLELNKQLYISSYIQLLMQDANIGKDAAEMLETKYFQPWMINSNSIRVSEESYEVGRFPEKRIVYVGKLDSPLIAVEWQNGKLQYIIQFQLPNGQVYDTIKLPLPKGLP